MDVMSDGIVKALKAVGMEVTAWQPGERHVLVSVRSNAGMAACPGCSSWSGRLHGTYARRLAERPCLDLQVTLELAMQRFKCLNPECSRQTFVECVDSLARSRQL